MHLRQGQTVEQLDTGIRAHRNQDEIDDGEKWFHGVSIVPV